MTQAARQTPDPTIYRVEDEVGEHEVQRYILEIFRLLVERYMTARGVLAHVGADQFIYWMQHDPTRSVAPDLYVLPGVTQGIEIGTWKIWEHGITPSFVLEVVGLNREKDYREAPKTYAEIGVRELVIYDPFPGRNRIAFQVYRWKGTNFVRVEASNGDRVKSRELGCFLRAVADRARLRLGVGPGGDQLFPTAEEAAIADRDAAVAEKEAERAAKEAALARIAELEAELARRQR